jgi:hypothetical protein
LIFCYFQATPTGKNAVDAFGYVAKIFLATSLKYTFSIKLCKKIMFYQAVVYMAISGPPACYHPNKFTGFN